MKNLSNIIFTKPKFTGLPSAWLEHVPLAFYLIEILKPSLFVELGTFTGASYFSFCQAVKQLGVSTQSFAIDHWKGDYQSGFINDRVFQLVDNINRNHFHEFSKLLRMSFDEAQPNFENNTIDLLHIDGCHTYEAAKHDFETWLPKMSDAGVIIFHDTNVRENNFGFWKLMNEIKDGFPNFQFNFGKGLGVVCTGKNVPDDFLWFVKDAQNESFTHQLFHALGSRWRLKNEYEHYEKDSRENIWQLTNRVQYLESQLALKEAYIENLKTKPESLPLQTIAVNQARPSIRIRLHSKINTWGAMRKK